MWSMARARVLAMRLLAAVTGVVGVSLVVWLMVVLRRVLPDDAGTTGPGVTAPGPAAPDPTSRPGLAIPDTLLGRSGRLRFVALTAAEADAIPGLWKAFGDTIRTGPASLALLVRGEAFSVFLTRPFAHKRGEMMGTYRLGWWPAERWMMAANYLNPDGFIEVTPANATTRVSTHFRLNDFLTHDQDATWPKYVLLEERLLDKLELILDELNRLGVDAGRAVVLSGFRAPYYNDLRIDEGAARASRHQYGDAADIIIDANQDGTMDDLNGDGRRDLRDVGTIGRAVSAVERLHPDLAGGLGSYAAMGPRGPFVHVDVRGTSARWERARLRGDSGRRR